MKKGKTDNTLAEVENQEEYEQEEVDQEENDSFESLDSKCNRNFCGECGKDGYKIPLVSCDFCIHS